MSEISASTLPPMSLGHFSQVTSYDSHAMRLHDEYESDADTLIARPAAAYTSSPYVFERQPALPGPTGELTPPQSPIHRPVSPSKSSTASSYFGVANVRLGPILARAGSSLGTRSKESSPTRQQPADDVTTSRTSVVSGRDSPSRKSKSSFADLFQVQGSSAPLSIGLVSTPRKENPPRLGSPHKASKSECTAILSQDASRRPGHLRRGSTLQAAATFLGFAPQTAQAPSPTRRGRFPIDENDSILNLDFEDELFPDGNRGIPKENALTEILGNGEKLFARVRTAYREKCQQLSDEQEARQADREELDEEHTRAEHLKKQLSDVATQLAEKEVEIASLHGELEERDRRARSIRLIGSTGRGSLEDFQDRERFFSLGLEDESSDSEEESSSESVFERPVSRSTAPSEADGSSTRGRQQQDHRTSLVWQDAAPFLPPESKLAEENRALRRRIAELEETVNGCLGLVDEV